MTSSNGASLDEVDMDLAKQLADLRLPQNDGDQHPPTVRILVVSDIDLESASALAESALAPPPRQQLAQDVDENTEKTHSNNEDSSSLSEDEKNLLGRVDLCIACGPFCREDDLQQYYQGRQQRRHRQRIAHRQNHHPRRSREETAALEGLVTAALSQLESIVCRVLFIPGQSDPITTISSSTSRLAYTKERRLTPNSRNIHQQWMPICPGLGVGGLLYFDWHRSMQQHQRMPSLDDADQDEDDDESDEDISYSDLEETESEEDNNSTNHHHNIDADDDPSTFSESNGVMNGDTAAVVEPPGSAEEYGNQFCSTLEQVVKLAPPVSKISSPSVSPHGFKLNGSMQTEKFQSILVTRYHPMETEQQSMHEQQSTKNQNDNNHSSASSVPLPPEHEAFCSLPHIQEHLLLAIASGPNSAGSSPDRPKEVSSGQVRFILPGSLRERGEFCLVDLAYMKDPLLQQQQHHHHHHHKAKDDYRWRVRKTRFQTINEYL